VVSSSVVDEGNDNSHYGDETRRKAPPLAERRNVLDDATNRVAFGVNVPLGPRGQEGA